MADPSKPVTMFTGKGGVGKTTCAAATALHFAEAGEASLVLSTDPIPSLSDIFEVTNGGHPQRVADNLVLAELGLADVKRAWDEKFGREAYQVFSSLVDIAYPEFVDFITSVLPGLQEEFLVDQFSLAFPQIANVRIQRFTSLPQGCLDAAQNASAACFGVFGRAARLLSGLSGCGFLFVPKCH